MPPRSCCTAAAATAMPWRTAATSSAPVASAWAVPARNESPAPIGLATGTRDGVDPPGAVGGGEGGAVGAGGDDGAAGAAGVQLAGGRDAAVDEVVALLLDVLVGAAEQQRLDLADVGADQVGPAGEGGAEHGGGGVDVRGDAAGVGGLDDVGVEGGRHVRGQRARAEHGGRAGRLDLLGDRREQLVVVPLVRLGAAAVDDGDAAGILEEDQGEAALAASAAPGGSRSPRRPAGRPGGGRRRGRGRSGGGCRRAPAACGRR